MKTGTTILKGVDYLSNLFAFLFSSEWTWVDNTPQGAANRIMYYLEKGFPIELRDYITYDSADDDFFELAEQIVNDYSMQKVMVPAHI